MSSFSATYNIYGISPGGTLTVDGSSNIASQIQVSDTANTLDSNAHFQVSGSDGPFDGTYRFSTQVSGPGGLEGFVAKGADGHTYFFTQETLPSGSQTLTPEAGSVPICFVEGTRIRTPDGEAPIEALKPHDLVMMADGRTAQVRWVGRQTVARAFADQAQLPIRVRANAIDNHVPCRDLDVSPGHALLVGGVLIQAGCLVNGTSIVAVDAVPTTFAYYHVELDEHGLILAENAPAETFIDNVDRARFDNWNEREEIDSEMPMAEMTLPRAKATRQVPRVIRERLERRGLALYGSTVQDAA